MHVRCRTLNVVFVACMLALLWPPVKACAGDVSDVVRDLYGGDGILLAPTPSPFPSHAPHFTASSLEGLGDLNAALTADLTTFAINAPLTGFTFDVELGVPVRAMESLGPLLAERAPTLGAGNLSVALTYSRVDFDRFDGTDLDDLSLTFLHDDVNGDGIRGPEGTPFAFELDEVQVDIDLEIEQDIFALFAVYGVTESLDVGIVLPIIRSRARADAEATIIRNSAVSEDVHNFDPAAGGDPRESSVDRSATGLGDIILRSKYNFLREEPTWPDLAVVGRLTLPTGDEDDLLGTGEGSALALFVASENFGRFTPHLNLGYELSTDSELSNLRYAVGSGFQVVPRLNVAFDILGRWEHSGNDIGDHIVDAAAGLKLNPFKDVLITGIVQTPLNRDAGLRADFIWTIGVEVPLF